MKVLLLEGVKNLGQAGDVVDVKPGYANNYLLRRDLAVKVTKDNMNVVKMRQEARAREAEQKLTNAHDIAEAIRGKHFVYETKAGSAGRLYGTVTSQNIADVLAEHGYDVDKRDITTDEAIKTVGSHEVSARLHPEITVSFYMDVKPEA